MNFGDALHILRNAGQVARPGWNGKGMFLFLVKDWAFGGPMLADSPMKYPTLPFIAMKTADDKVVPWLASQTDILAMDWEQLK